ncbi:17204_t:CDS:10 [Cetraspora pellucida]|uniref:17204_t:CDS:1 n=1 Tax=Cetraspora pellucida TaxID=1433469 RepID=A0A9N9FL90_9GLOM|nr:17204_t:CDS:10 [Cetraspora pellucida]
MNTLLYSWAFLFITIFLLTILPTGLTQNVIKFSEFIYTERPIQSNLTGRQPFIIDIGHYRDGQNTAIIRTARESFDVGINRCFERRLLLRIIHENRSVIPINFDNIEEIQDINYCYVNAVKNPIGIYPLFDQYILVTYTHATNTADNTTFVDRGVVLDWSGKNISTLEFGPSFLNPGTTNWIPSSFISININPKRGFLRLSGVSGTNDFEWRQYAYNGDGSFSLLQSDKNYNIGSNTFQATVFATLSGGYAIVYANTTITSTLSNSLSAQFTANAGIYAIILNYNQSYTSDPIILHEMPTPNLLVAFTSLYCSVDYANIGHICILSGLSANNTRIITPTTTTSTTPTTSITPFYIKVRYAVILRTPIVGQIINFTFNLYDEDNRQFKYAPLTSNLVDNGYGNLNVDTTYPQKGISNLALNTEEISITFHDRVSFSYSDANLTIYQRINQTDIIRQLINAKTCSKCAASDKVITLDVFRCTFNDPGGQYYIQMDNNFIKSSEYGEPMLGIGSNMWTFQTGNVLGKLRLTTNGTLYFQKLNESEKQDFFTNIINELVIIIPTEDRRLESNKHNQIDTSSDELKILISLSIIAAQSGDKKNTTSIKDDLDLLIRNKQYTNISTGAFTNYLDETYGFQKTAIVVFLLVFAVATLRSPESENFAILQFGIAIFRIITVTAFTFTDAKGIQALYIPSVVFLAVPLGFNLILAFSILFMQRDDKFVEWFARYGRSATLFALLAGSSIDILLVLKSYLMKFEIFNAPFSDKSLKMIFWGSCADVLLADIPQFIIQIFYLLYSVEIEFLLIFSLIASGLSVLSNLLSKLFFIKFKAYSPYLSTLYIHHAVESNDSDDFNDDKKIVEVNKDI